MRPNNFPLLCSLVLIASLTGSALAIAHGGAKGIVKERMQAMESLGRAMKSIGRMARGKKTLEIMEVVRAAESIAQHGQRLPTLFPAGSSFGITEASPKIWKDPEGFKTSNYRMIAAARVLEGAARTDDLITIKGAYKALGKTCSSCHQQYRARR